MIEKIIPGDITDPENDCDIIVGMNTKFAEPSAIGNRVLAGKQLLREIDLGDVVTFQFDAKRKLHLLVCHHFITGGWMNAEKFIRFGLDYLWQRDRSRPYSIVEIGTGPVGVREGADAVAIRTAMADSFLRLHLYIWRGEMRQVERAGEVPRALRPLRTWRPGEGEREITEIHAAAA